MGFKQACSWNAVSAASLPALLSFWLHLGWLLRYTQRFTNSQLRQDVCDWQHATLHSTLTITT
jgi:hypothetical protein